MAKNALIAVLILSVIGLLSYILKQENSADSSSRASVEQAPLTPQAGPRGSTGSAVTNEKVIIGDHTIGYQRFDPPLLAWTNRNGGAEIELIGVVLNELNESQNELLLLSKIEVKVGGYCGASIKNVFRRVANEEGDLSAPTSTTEDCGVSEITLNDQWVAFAVESKLREFHIWHPPTDWYSGDTPTGDMYISVVDSETIKVRIE